MSLHVTFSVPADLEQVSIICGGDLAVQGEVRDTIRVTYPEGTTQPKLEPADGGLQLHIEDDARVQVPDSLNVVLAAVGGDVACNNLGGTLRADHAPGDASINNCRDATFDTVNGDLALNRVDVGAVAHVNGDVSLNHVGEISIDHVAGDLAANHCTTVSVELVNGDSVFNHVDEDVDVRTIHGDAAVNDISGSVRFSEVHGGVVLHGSVSAGQRVHVRTWDSVTAMLAGPISLHSMTHLSDLPDWEEIRRQPARIQQDGGAEVLIAAGDEFVFAGDIAREVASAVRSSIPPTPVPPNPPRPVGAEQTQSASPGGSRPAADDDETLMVLTMIQQGKITPEEGDMLLDALSR